MRKTKFLNCGFEVKELSDEGEIEGYASTFNNVDLGLDVVKPGAFKKTLRESKGKFPILFGHNPHEKIGVNLEAKEDDRGLFVRGVLDVKNNQKAKEAFSSVKMDLDAGLSPGLSIGYITIKEEPQKDNPAIRELKEVKLLEYSIVTFPMNTEASATAAKEWRDCQGNIDEQLKLMIECMTQKGFSKTEIYEALERAASTSDEPTEIGHLFKDGLDSLRAAMKN